MSAFWLRLDEVSLAFIKQLMEDPSQVKFCVPDMYKHIAFQVFKQYHLDTERKTSLKEKRKLQLNDDIDNDVSLDDAFNELMDDF